MSFVPITKGKGSWKYAGTQYVLSMIKYVITIVLNKMVLFIHKEPTAVPCHYSHLAGSALIASESHPERISFTLFPI